MKKLYIFALAIIGIYVCLNLSSCKKDDKNEPKQPEASIKMRPTSVSWEDKYGSKIAYENIEYYKDLQVKSYMENYYSSPDHTEGQTLWESDKYEYSYSDTNISLSIFENGSAREVSYRLKDGLVIYADGQARDEKGTYEYEGNKLILRYEGEDPYVYGWENGNMSFRKNGENSRDAYSFTYTDYPCYVWVPTLGAEFLNGEQFEDINQFLVMGGYFGQIPKNLVMLARDLYDPSEVITFDYEFNEIGYPTKIIYNDDGWIETATIIWEEY